MQSRKARAAQLTVGGGVNGLVGGDKVGETTVGGDSGEGREAWLVIFDVFGSGQDRGH